MTFRNLTRRNYTHILSFQPIWVTTTAGRIKIMRPPKSNYIYFQAFLLPPNVGYFNSFLLTRRISLLTWQNSEINSLCIFKHLFVLFFNICKYMKILFKKFILRPTTHVIDLRSHVGRENLFCEIFY